MTKLIADIGGTNARFAIAGDDGFIHHVETLACDHYPSPAAAVLAYLSRHRLPVPDRACFAVATPVDGNDRITMTNHHWDFSIRDTVQETGIKTLDVINDFVAVSLGVPQLAADDKRQIGGGHAIARAPIAVIGPGTGLGTGAVVFDDRGNPLAVPAEGGHVTMPLFTARERAIGDWFIHSGKYHHVSAERLCSGKGIANLYTAIQAVDGISLPPRDPAAITAAALSGDCATCAEILDLFCHFLGVVAGNLALSLGARGGVYIAGGIVGKLGESFDRSRFRASFESKGRFRDYLTAIPVYVITHATPALLGLNTLKKQNPL